MLLTNKIILVSVVMTLIFSGCGQAEYSLEDVDPTSQGKFLDEAVEGLGYRSTSGEASLTTNGGYFEYKSRDKIEFYIGALKFGDSIASEIITPRELVKGTSVIEDPSVNNRVRFMLALDSDIQRIGIQINEATRILAKDWNSSMDFSVDEAAFSNEVERVIHDSIQSLPTALPSKAEAHQHFSKTLRCAYSGGYEGSWVIPDSNDTTGFVGAMIEANGHVVVMGNGQVVNGQEDTIVYVTGKHDVNDQRFEFNTSTASILASTTFYYDRDDAMLKQFFDEEIIGEGKSISYDHIEGSFENADGKGKYLLNRADAIPNAAYRYTGFGYAFDPNNSGLDPILGMIIFDIDSAGQVSGMIHDVRDPYAQTQLHGIADYDANTITIVVESEPKAILRGSIDYTHTSGSTRIEWYPDVSGSPAPFGYAQVEGCQLQAIDNF